MTAPTPPLDTIDDQGQPVFKNPTQDEVKRMEVYPDISNGAIKFAQTYVSIFDKRNIFFSSEVLVDWMNIFCDIPTENDKRYFADIKHGSDPSHSHYSTLMKNWFK